MSAQQIQVKLREDNEGKPEKEQIHVRVGLNYGTGLVEDNDVYGDVVSQPDGYIENAPKDMVTALPGQITRIKATFDKPGRYVWHCHILSHEDHEMMRVLHVGPGA